MGLDKTAQGTDLPPLAVVFGRSEAMRTLRANLERLANANVPVLLQGESGTGKEVIARLIHQSSPWGGGPFVNVNCRAVPGSLLESELFGYEKGAFAGANVGKPGRLELAHRGTLFLDEISELDLGLQSKLLQFLQDGQFCRMEAQENRSSEIRLICASKRRLEDEVAKGSFRQDLFYRINVVTVLLPPLRQRACDIPILVDYFLATFNERHNGRANSLSDRVMELLAAHSWPGNIRQLENLIRRYVILGTEESIVNELVPNQLSYVAPRISLDNPVSLKEITRAAVRDVEKQVILKILQANHWNRRRTARALKISYRALLYKLKGVGILSPNDNNRAAVSND